MPDHSDHAKLKFSSHSQSIVIIGSEYNIIYHTCAFRLEGECFCLCLFIYFYRKSSTGVDWFILDSKPGDATRIHRAVEYWARHIVQETRNRGTSDPTSVRTYMYV